MEPPAVFGAPLPTRTDRRSRAAYGPRGSDQNTLGPTPPRNQPESPPAESWRPCPRLPVSIESIPHRRNYLPDEESARPGWATDPHRVMAETYDNSVDSFRHKCPFTLPTLKREIRSVK